jgi:hypothetical protein
VPVLVMGGAAIGLAVSAGLVEPGFEETGIGLAFLGGTIAALMVGLPFADRARVHGAGERYLSAKTLSGWRTVDLHRLRRVWRLRVPTDARMRVDRFVITDANRVRLVVDAPVADEALRRVYAEGHGEQRFSRGVLDRLEIIERSLRVRMAAALIRFVLAMALYAAVLAAAFTVAWFVGTF